MQLTHVSTNLRQGLRRNLSMHAAVILTLFVSLTLAGVGVLFKFESHLISDELGSELTLNVFLCTDHDTLNPGACTAEINDADREQVLQTIEANPEVDGAPSYTSKQEAYDRAYDQAKRRDDAVAFEGRHPAVTVADFPSSFVVTLKDPNQSAGIESAVRDLPGVSRVQNSKDLVGPAFTVLDVLRVGSWIGAGFLVLVAVMLVANTIRLTALARRKEIEIMRLVGASRIFIALPFLLEALFDAFVGVVLSGGALAAFTQFVIFDRLERRLPVFPYVTWHDFGYTMAVVVVAGPLLTILPTLLMTRKYLRV